MFGMSPVLNKKSLIILFLSVFALITARPADIYAKAVCTILTQNLSYGATNSKTSGQVAVLQDFLHAAGYLSVVPTGRYGSLTVSAVKRFQSANRITSTGYAGPLTRSAIVLKSCSLPVLNPAPVSAPAPVTAVVPAATSTNAVPVSVAVSNFITNPKAGAVLTIGGVYPIQWTGSENESSIDIMLEDSSGLDVGYVAANLSGRNYFYNWTAGNVSLAGRQNAVIPPGDYRLVIKNSGYSSSFSLKSRIFSIKEIPLSIGYVLPSSIANDRKTGITLYGDGFNSLTRVSFIGPYNSTSTPQYVSPDGKLVWMYLPPNVYSGQYQVSAVNDYSVLDNVATSTASNSVTLQIN